MTWPLVLYLLWLTGWIGSCIAWVVGDMRCHEVPCSAASLTRELFHGLSRFVLMFFLWPLVVILLLRRS